MTFQTANQLDPRDRASLQPPAVVEPLEMPRDKQMPWAPDIVLDATEWLQRAALGNPDSVKMLVFKVAPAMLQEIKRLRALTAQQVGDG